MTSKVDSLMTLKLLNLTPSPVGLRRESMIWKVEPLSMFDVRISIAMVFIAMLSIVQPWMRNVELFSVLELTTMTPTTFLKSCRTNVDLSDR